MDLLLDLKRRLEEDVRTLKDYLARTAFDNVGAYREVQGRISALNVELQHIDDIVQRVNAATGI